MREIYEFLYVKGGPVMYGLTFLSVITLAIFLERLWALQRNRVFPPGLTRLLRRLINEGRLGEAAAITENNTSSVGFILGAGMAAHGKPREILREKMEDAGAQEAANLERFMNTLGTIAGIATLLGLFGTVIGMITVFQRVSESVGLDLEERTRLLSSGIYEVLINTASGLFIAVGAIVAHTYLVNRINRYVLELEAEAKQFVDLLDTSGAQPAAPGTPPHSPPTLDTSNPVAYPPGL